MNRQEIEAWLSDPKRSYQKGVEIYKEHGPKEKKNILSFLQNAQNPKPESVEFNMLLGNVRKCLAKVINNTPEPEEIQTVAIKETPFVKKGAKDVKQTKFEAIKERVQILNQVQLNTLPAELQEEYAVNQERTALLAQLRGELEHCDEPETRKELAEQICNIDDARAAFWAKVDALFDPSVKEQEIFKMKSYVTKNFKSKTPNVLQEVDYRIKILAQNGINVTIENGKISYSN